ncbi:MAG: hypothetical protein AAF704_06335 [Cyanobacteria bacterium P01_D01_bin.123]
MTSTIPAIASIPWAAPLLDEANTLPQLDKPITFPERRETTPISSRVTMDWDLIAAIPQPSLQRREITSVSSDFRSDRCG